MKLKRISILIIFFLCSAQNAFCNQDDCAGPTLPDPVFGLTPLRFDWSVVAFRPDTATEPPLNLRVPIPSGAIQMTYDPSTGYHLFTPPGITLRNEAPTDIRVTISEDTSLNNDTLSSEDWENLNASGWKDRVGDTQALWVSVPRQRLYLLQGETLLWQCAIATSRLGTGQVANSMQTPLGWHRIAEKFGEGAKWGQVFKSRAGTAKIWDGEEVIAEGLVVSRILWLEGLEEGHNKGKNAAGEVVDSKQRYIYIHGTNKEHCIGAPMSDGCVNMYNDDVIRLYGVVPVGTMVLISGE